MKIVTTLYNLKVCVYTNIFAWFRESTIHVIFTDKTYECKDGHALIIDSNLTLLCPPNEEMLLQSPSVLNRIPLLLPVTRVGVCLN